LILKSKAWSLLVALALLTAGCGGGDDAAGDGVASIDDVVTTASGGAETTSTTVAGESDEEAVLEFASCMRQRNIDFPDPNVDADGNVGFDLAALRDLTGMDEDELQAAFEGCLPLLAGVSFGFERIFDAEFQDDLVAFTGCMRENGFDMPDPDFAALTTTGEIFPSTLDINDPDFDTAFEACQDTLPGIPGLAGS
jgi:hypothetical protein